MTSYPPESSAPKTNGQEPPPRHQLLIWNAQEDKEVARELKKHLGALAHIEVLTSEIPAGENTLQRMNERMQAADIVLPLLSADFINSQKDAFEEARRHKKQARVIPILARACTWEEAGFGDMQVLPRSEIPLAHYQHLDEPLHEAVQEIGRAAVPILTVSTTGNNAWNYQDERTVRVLHLSDLLVSEEDDDEDKGHWKIWKDGLREVMIETGEAFDYLIVCGNLTIDGKKESFENAAAILRSWAKDFVQGSEHLTRIFMVPGPNDVNQENPDFPFTEFGRFHDKFFHNAIEVGVVKKWSETIHPISVSPGQRERSYSLLLRELKDMTMVGVCFDCQDCPDSTSHDPSMQGHDLLATLEDAVEKAVEQVGHLEYRERTPTLLVTAETPVLDNGMRQRMVNRRKFHANLKRLGLDFHFFGASQAICLPFEPFAFDHIGLGTGPRSQVRHSRWPLRMNEITLNYGLGEEWQAEALVIKAYMLQETVDEWAEKRILNGELDNRLREIRKVGPETRRQKLLHSELRAKISEWLSIDSSAILVVQGFPGSGLDRIFPGSEAGPHSRNGEIIHGVVQLNRGSAPFLSTSWSTYQDMEDRLRKMRAEAIKFRKPILVFNDRASRRVRKTGDRIDKLLEYQEEFAAFLDNDVLILYVADVSEDIASLFAGKDWNSVHLKLGPLEREDFKTLLKPYLTHVPLAPQHLERLTGRFMGFSEDLSRAAVPRFFDAWQGDRVIQAEGRATLLDDVLKDHFRIRERVRNFERAISHFSSGLELLAFLRGRVENVENKESEPGAEGRRPEKGREYPLFSLNELRQVFRGKGADYSDLQGLIKNLVECGLLSELPEGDYAVKVQVPFLCKMD